MCERRKEPTGCQLLGVMPNQGTGWWRLSVLWRSPGQGGKTFSTDEAYKSPKRFLRNDGGNFVSPHRGRHSRHWTLRDLDFSSPFALLTSLLPVTTRRHSGVLPRFQKATVSKSLKFFPSHHSCSSKRQKASLRTEFSELTLDHQLLYWSTGYKKPTDPMCVELVEDPNTSRREEWHFSGD